MAFELFRRKQEAYNELMLAVDRIKAVLPLLSAEETQALLAGLEEAIHDAGKLSARSLFTTTPETHRFPPAEAVRRVLRKFPQGLPAGEIVRLAQDMVETSSGDPTSVIYSAIAHLKRQEEVDHDIGNKTYRLRPHARESSDDSSEDDLAGKTALECCQTILKERDEPMHALAIAREALRRGYIGRATGTQEKVEATTYKSFWAEMSRCPETFTQTDTQTYALTS